MLKSSSIFFSKVFILTTLITSLHCGNSLYAFTPNPDSLLIKVLANKKKMLRICADEKYKFTPKLKHAYLNYAKSMAMYNLAVEKKQLPAKFLEWVDSDPIVKATVYGVHFKASDVLQHLFSLRLDLGKEKFMKYKQLMLAEAIVNAKKGQTANISARKPLRKVVIPRDPRKKVNTKDPKRKLDINDHIINFLNSNTINAKTVRRRELAELKYDDRGIAIPAPKTKKTEVGKMEKRTLYAADVLASRSLQKKFNAYMKSKGHNVNIDCGEKIIHWNSHDMVKGEQGRKIDKAFHLFKTAYEEKGLLPKQRDPAPTSGEDLFYIIRNYEHKFSPKQQGNKKWDPFPITAPWPTLVMLTAYNQPLREREERWVAYRDKGEFVGYGEYIGKIAQQFNMQSARRLTPYPFYYGTIQMMLKDGGVCGTMANMGVRSMHTLGTPAVTAGQPGHCALISMKYDQKSKTYSCRGGQYATGGDDKTHPHAGWMFGNVFSKDGKLAKLQRKPMIYHQTIAYAVNYGLNSYLDSMMAHGVFELLPEPVQKEKGAKLLASGLAINPYNFTLVDSSMNLAQTPYAQVSFWNVYQKQMAAIGEKSGCPTDGLYNKTVKNNMFSKMLKMPVPDDKPKLAALYKFLQKEKCDNTDLMALYQLKLMGPSKLLASTKREFKNQLELMQSSISKENDKTSAKINETIKAAADMVKNDKLKKKWALAMWDIIKGNEKYFGQKNDIYTNQSVATLASLAQKEVPSEEEMIQSLLKKICSELKESVSGKRNLKKCEVLAKKIRIAETKVTDSRQKNNWLHSLAKVLKGKDKFKERSNLKVKEVTDPCATTVAKLLKKT